MCSSDLGAAGGLALRNQAVPDPGAVAAAIDAAANPAPPPPPPLDPKILEPMRARVGAVHRVAPMLTEAETQLRAGETDLAIAAAERAVVADPDRVDALGLLLTLYAETNRFPEAWQPLLDAAMARSPNDPSTRRAQSALALARGDLPGAEAAAQDCLKDTRDSVICREALAAAREAMASDAASAIPVLAELDAIVAVEPDNVRVRRRAALLAAKVDAPGAEARLDALIQETDDRTLLEARARLAVLDADLDLARKLEIGRAHV